MSQVRVFAVPKSEHYRSAGTVSSNRTPRRLAHQPDPCDLTLLFVTASGRASFAGAPVRAEVLEPPETKPSHTPLA